MLKQLIQLTIIASAAWAFNAQAAVDMFLRIDQPFIAGEAQDANHGNEIEVLAWSWGMSNSNTTHTGGGGGAGATSFQDLSLTKYIDKSSTKLYEHLASGQNLVEAKLTIRKTGSQQVEYLIITMKDLLVTSVSAGSSGGEDRLTENISLNFREYCVKYTPQNDQGAPLESESTETCWDIAANAVP